MEIEQVTEDFLPEGVRAELEAKCKREIIALEIRGKVFAFRPPTRVENRRLREQSERKGIDKEELSEGFMVGCCVYPGENPGEELRQHFDLWPMAIGSSSLAFSRACGLDISVLGK
jgi:hypothetical protein